MSLYSILTAPFRAVGSIFSTPRNKMIGMFSLAWGYASANANANCTVSGVACETAIAALMVAPTLIFAEKAIGYVFYGGNTTVAQNGQNASQEQCPNDHGQRRICDYYK